jgi:formamidopyrimidine-DNA glycosylase
MPEIPDIEVFCASLKKTYAGKKLTGFKVVNEKKLKDDPRVLTQTLEGKTLKDVYRSGKELRFLFSENTLLGMHLMLTGDIIPFEGNNERKSTIVEFHFGDGKALALTDRMKNAFVKLAPEDKGGIDALDKGLNFSYLKKALQRKAVIKNVLLDQDVIRGIGNAYSDEILWESRISPFSVANAVPDEAIRELAKNIKGVLRKAIKQISKHHPDLIHGEVRDFLNIHSKTKKESPTGFPIQIKEKGIAKTYFTEEQVLYT